MNTAQLPLPFDQAEMTLSKPLDKSQKKTKSSKRFVKIRIEELTRAEQDDEIYRLACMFAADVDLDEYIDEETIRMSCIRCRADMDRNNVNCFIAYDGDYAVGFLVSVASQAFHRQGIVAEQKLWYVEPSRRGTIAARKLLKAYDSWAKLLGATQIYTGTANERYAERTSKLLQHLGYRRVGSIHVKEI